MRPRPNRDFIVCPLLLASRLFKRTAGENDSTVYLSESLGNVPILILILLFINCQELNLMVAFGRQGWDVPKAVPSLLNRDGWQGKPCWCGFPMAITRFVKYPSCSSGGALADIHSLSSINR